MGRQRREGDQDEGVDMSIPLDTSWRAYLRVSPRRWDSWGICCGHSNHVQLAFCTSQGDPSGEHCGHACCRGRAQGGLGQGSSGLPWLTLHGYSDARSPRPSVEEP